MLARKAELMPRQPRPEPPQQQPAVQKLRIKYSKTGPARFTSHRDFSRCLERALRRAQVPMAYSSGFHPHPKISFANAAPTSAETEAEFLEIAVVEQCDPDKVRDALTVELPHGLHIVSVVEAQSGSLVDQLTASTWHLRLPSATTQTVTKAVDALLASAECEVERMTKSGKRSFDVRAAIIDLTVVSAAPIPTVEFTGKIESPLVRPDDVLSALTTLVPELATDGYVARRITQGRWENGHIIEPF